MTSTLSFARMALELLPILSFVLVIFFFSLDQAGECI
jgi:hypothetical protein